MVSLGLAIGCDLQFGDVPVVLGRPHPLEPFLAFGPDVFGSYVGGEVHYHDLMGGGEVFLGGPSGGSHAEAGMH